MNRFFLFIFLLVAQSGSAQEIRKQLDLMPKNEKEQLADFFEKGLHAGCFGYTIFGDKPVSLYVHKGVDVDSIKRLWQKCVEQFKIKNFVIKFQDSDHPRYHFIYLINVKSVRTIIDTHKTVFKNSLDGDRNILTALLDDSVTLEAALNHHEALKGILLGFGINSSFLFHRKTELIKKIKAHVNPPCAFAQSLFSENDLQMIFGGRNGFYKNYTKSEDCVHISPKLIELVDEYHALEEVEALNHEPLSFYGLPEFVREENDPEVQMLMNKYKTTREQIIQALTDDDHLGVILCKMAQ